MKCVACGFEKTKKDLLYTEDKQPVCANPFTCVDEHPNSATNIIARKGAIKLFANETELENNELQKIEVDEATKKRIITIFTKPQSIRLSKLPIARYIVGKMDESPDLNSISEVVRHCVEIAMQVEPLQGEAGTHQGDVQLVTPVNQPTPEVIEKSKGVKIVVEPKPSLNVDWAEIDRQIAEEKATKELMEKVIPDPDEDDDMTF